MKAARPRSAYQRRILIFTFICFSLCPPCLRGEFQVPASTASAPQNQNDNAKKAVVLLNQMVQALGGQAWLTFQDMAQEGRTYGFHGGRPTGAAAPFWRFWKWPDKDRIELTKQRDWIIIHNGDNGYEITFRGVFPEEPKPLADFLRRRHYSVERVLRQWIHEPGVAFFYEGAAVAEGKPAEKVTVLNAKNESVTFWIDSAKYLPVKKSYSTRDAASREMDTEEEIFDNYHDVQGIATPFNLTRRINGEMNSQRFLHKVTYNTGIADSQFAATPTPPRKK